MKNLIVLFVLALCVQSCKKEMPNAELRSVAKDRYEVVFNVSDFSPQVEVISKGDQTSEAPLKDHAKFFIYLAYNSDGIEVSRIFQELESGIATRFYNPEVDPINAHADIFGKILGKQTFGCVRDTLPTGNYMIVMVASNRFLSVNNRGLSSPPDYLKFDDANFYFDRGLDSWSRAEDTFFKKFPYSVQQADSKQEVTLDRIVAKAEINILDSKPGTIFRFLFDGENEAFQFANEQPFGSTEDVFFEQFDPSRFEVEGKANLSFSKFLINTATNVNVIIKVYEQGNLSATKTIENVRFQRNKRTILTGNIYPTTVNAGFNVTVNEQFDKDTIKISF